MAKKPVRRKHLPQRTCVGCREVLPKRSLIRIVRITADPDSSGIPESAGVLQIDPTGKLAGRGAYLHDRRSCWEKGLKGALAHALKVDLTPRDRELLVQYMNSLSEEQPLEAEILGKGRQ